MNAEDIENLAEVLGAEEKDKKLVGPLGHKARRKENRRAVTPLRDPKQPSGVDARELFLQLQAHRAENPDFRNVIEDGELK